MDDIDKANDVVERQRENVIARIQQEMRRVNADEDCIDCERPIPAARRAKMPGAIRCVSCQGSHEKMEKMYRK